MGTHSSVSQQLVLRDSLSVVTSTADVNSDSRKAWYLLSLILSIGRPVPLPELCLRCTPFRATPDLIRRLCSVPNSPIALTYLHGEGHINGGYVKVSMLGSLWIRALISNKQKQFGMVPLNVDMENEDLETTRPFKRFHAACLEAPFSTVENVSWDGRSVSEFIKILLNNKVAIPECFTKTVGSRLEYRLEGMENKLTSAAILEGEEQKSVTSAEVIDFQTVNMCMHEAEFYTRTNGDAEICVREEVHDSAIIPMEFQIANDLFDTTKAVVSRLEYRLEDMEHMEDELISAAIVEVEKQKSVTSAEAIGDTFQTVNKCTHEAEKFYSRTNGDAEICVREVHDSAIISIEVQSANDLFDTTNQLNVETLRIVDNKDIGFAGIQVESNGNNATVKIGPPGLSNENGCEEKKLQPSSKKGGVPTDANNQNGSKRRGFSDAERHLSKSSPKTMIANRYGMPSRHEALRESFDGIKKAIPVQGNQQQGLDHKKTISRSSKRKHEDMERREGRNDVAVISSDQVEPEGLPSFESYIVEEEEGSGGYGIVYRARKKDDGMTVAIKCPHEKAHKQHVINERRMLEQFGGKNCIIRYEGCIKSETSECFVLEHVDHDRPEVLKKEIDLVQLRWYGYCLFRALSSLHKQGIVHRDVKPGNFLFSRKASKGYLIDFNLALDLQQKYGTKKIKAANDKNFSDVMLQKTKSFQLQNSKSLDIVSREESKGSKKILEPRNSKKKTGGSLKARNDMGRWNFTQSQGAEGSGITSVKDVTSTRTPSAERVRQPLPVLGRKGLLNFLKDTIDSPNHEASSVPTFARKRVAAPSSKVDRRHIYVTPMPLQPSSTTITVTGLTNNKDAMLKKEGPCVGTKGFRAPEVLLRSLYQGPKVDSWSAGVTLLYLMIGRTPFYGEPEQNIKEIAKLRGSEDLWEVAKLHDRESSFPPDLYTSQSLPSYSLWEWCKINTKRNDFLEQMPASLMDLVDKCLTVNPRSRISAEDALNHEFFGPINERLKKPKLVRPGSNKDSGSRLSLHRQSSTEPLAVFDQEP